MRFLIYTLGNILALFLSARIIPDVSYSGSGTTLALAGLALAILNLAVAPILKIITFPLRVLTFNLFSLVIDMAMVWALDALIPELRIQGLIALFWTTLIVMVINALLWTILSPSHKS